MHHLKNELMDVMKMCAFGGENEDGYFSKKSLQTLEIILFYLLTIKDYLGNLFSFHAYETVIFLNKAIEISQKSSLCLKQC